MLHNAGEYSIDFFLIECALYSLLNSYHVFLGFWHRVGSLGSLDIFVIESEFIDNRAKDFILGITEAEYNNNVTMKVVDTIFMRNQVTEVYSWFLSQEKLTVSLI